MIILKLISAFGAHGPCRIALGAVFRNSEFGPAHRAGVVFVILSVAREEILRVAPKVYKNTVLARAGVFPARQEPQREQDIEHNRKTAEPHEPQYAAKDRHREAGYDQGSAQLVKAVPPLHKSSVFFVHIISSFVFAAACHSSAAIPAFSMLLYHQNTSK